MTDASVMDELVGPNNEGIPLIAGSYYLNPVKSESTVIMPPSGMTLAEKLSDSSTLAKVFSVMALFGTMLTTKSIVFG